MAPLKQAVRTALAALCVATAAGCGGTRIENAPLAAGQANVENRAIVPDSPDRPVILMAFSGGGSRAAALAAAVLGEMNGTTYAAGGNTHKLTDDVKLISSVSGGSVTAAWFGLWRADRLDQLRDDFLVKDNMATLELDAANPITWFKLVFSDFTRIDALEDIFDRELFDKATFADMNKPGRPLIVLNTTDMAGGETFGLTARRFDDICSKFDALPISTGVAASAAFPVALSPVNFQDYSTGCAGTLRSDAWAAHDLSAPSEAYENLQEYKDARYTNDLRHGPNPFRNIEYLHFLDGGVADNLGLTSLRSALIEPYDDAHGLLAINEGKIRKLVIIMVNARSDPPSTLYQSKDRPGTISMLETVTSVPIDANTASSQSAFAGLLTEIAKAAQSGANAKFAGMKIYGIDIDFDQIPTDTPDHAKLRNDAKDVPTSWTLTRPQRDTIDTAGIFLLRRHPCYRQLIADLDATQPASAQAVEAPQVVCLTDAETISAKGGK